MAELMKEKMTISMPAHNGCQYVEFLHWGTHSVSITRMPEALRARIYALLEGQPEVCGSIHAPYHRAQHWQTANDTDKVTRVGNTRAVMEILRESLTTMSGWNCSSWGYLTTIETLDDDREKCLISWCDGRMESQVGPRPLLYCPKCNSYFSSKSFDRPAAESRIREAQAEIKQFLIAVGEKHE